MSNTEGGATALRPVKLNPTRVWRTYLGGQMIERWRGADDPADGRFPEEWVASVVEARNPGREHLREGLSVLAGTESEPVALRDWIAADPAACLGAAHMERYGAHPGLLVKLLDSAERLAIQVHPDRVTAERLFGSVYGKTEAWYFLGGRAIGGERPYVLCGFKPGMTRERWERLFREQDVQGMIDGLHKLYPQPGDVMLIRGGMPHAIGPGNWMVEIQEPTDYTIRTERVTPSGLELAEQAIHQGIGYEAMFDCFAYDTWTEAEAAARCTLPSRIEREGDGWRERRLIGYEQTPYFRLSQVTIAPGGTAPELTADGRFSIGIVLAGSGRLRWPGGEMAIARGDQLFVPAALASVGVACAGGEPLELVRCFPGAL